MSADDDRHSKRETAPATAVLSPDQISQFAKHVADALGEKSAQPIEQIGQLIEKCGWSFVEATLRETDATEAAGGLLTQDRKRRRSKGGVFFYLAKGRMDPKLRSAIFPNFGKGGDGTIAPPGIAWEDRIAPMQALGDEAGQISSLTVNLTGRPGKLRIDGSSVMTVLEQRAVKAPPYPKGVPHFDTIEGVTSFFIFMSLRHWKRVEKALEDETDLLVIEGSAVYDAALKGVAILSTRVSTKALDYQRRKAKSMAAKTETHLADKQNPKAETPAGAKLDAPDLTGLPPEAADKLTRHYSAAQKLRRKLAAMEASGQDSGLKMTRRLLEQTEKQIASLRRQYDR